MAVAGTALVLSYVGGADARAMAGARTVEVLVAAKDIPAGTPAKQLASYVSAEQVPAKVVPAGTVSNLGQLAGKVAAVNVVAGEQLLSARFASPADLEQQGAVNVPKGMQELTISLEPQRVVGGQLKAGDTVGLFFSLEKGAAGTGSPVTHLTLHKVLVTGVQGLPAAAEKTGGAAAPVPGGSVLVTLAVSAKDAEKIVYAQEFARTWLSKEPDSAYETGTRELTGEGLYR
jgi:pilus assembly protein CpaB